MDIQEHPERGYIEVWLTNEEQQTIDRKAVTKQLLANAGHPKKCKVVFFLSGTDDLYERIEGLLLSNAKHC